MGQLSPGRWTPENHEKIVSFLLGRGGGGAPPHAPREPALALFDADNTAWTGDLGDATLIFLLKNLGLSPRLHELLPEMLDVPGEGFGVDAPGRLFPAARVREALEAMTLAYRRAIAPSASTADLLRAFSEPWILPGGPLHGDAAFARAYRLYTGTIVATYNLLEACVGCLAFDFADRRVATPLFGDAVRGFYGWEIAHGGGDLAPFTRPGPDGRADILFPAILDTGPDQRALQAKGRLGAYGQIAVWEALDKTPDELRAIALQVWEASPVDTPFDVVFPVDPASATAPVPVDFAAGPPLFASGSRLAGDVALGATSMLQGTRTRPEIVDLMAAMTRHGIVPAVITASHVDLVRAVLDRHYGFAGLPIVGMLPVLEGGTYGPDLTAPATYRTGKVDAARHVARLVTGREDARPVLCAGDTNTDLELLAYSSAYRLFFDRGKRPFMDLAAYLARNGDAESTLVQPPFG